MEEDIKILEEFLCTSHLSFGDATRCALALRRIKDRYRELEEKIKRYKRYLENKDKKFEEALEYEYQERETDYIPKSKIKELKEENEINIDKMRQFKHSSPFDFGVLNGIDECCRKLLEGK